MVHRTLFGIFTILLIFSANLLGKNNQESSLQTSFDHSNGLLNSAYTNLFKASDGTIWANSDKGPAWFDNYTWHSIKSFHWQNSISMYGPLDELSTGEIITTHNDTLYIFTKNNWKKRVYYFQGKPLAVHTAVSEGKSIVMKVHSEGSQLTRIVRITGNRLEILNENNKILEGYFNNVTKTRSGGLLYFLEKSISYSIQGKTNKLFDIPFPTVAPLRLDVQKNGDGFICFASTPRDFHIVRFNIDKPGIFNVLNLPYYLYPRWCELKSNGELLIMNRGGNIYEVGRNGEINQVGQNWSVGSRNFVIEINPHELWMGSYGKLHRLRFKSPYLAYQKFSYPNQFNFVNALYKDKNQNTWIGLDIGLVRKSSNGTQTYFLNVGRDSIREVTTIAEDDGGKVWVGSGSRQHSTFCFDGKVWKKFDSTNGFTNHSVHKIIKSLDGSLYFILFSNKGILIGNGQGVLRLKNGKFSEPSFSKALGNSRIYDIIQTKDSSIYLAGQDFLLRYSGDSIQYFKTKDNQNPGRIYDLAINKQGEIYFFSTPFGIGKLANDTVQFLSDIQEKDSRKSVAEIYFDNHGILWYTGAEGISAWYNGTNYQLDQRLGLKTQASWPIIGNENYLLIGTNGEGIQYLSDSLLKIPLPQVSIKNIISEDVTRGISWNAITWNHEYPNDYSIRYQINQEPWSEWSNEHQILIPGLKPGNNRVKFQIRGLVPNLLLEKKVYETNLFIPYPIFIQPTFLIPFSILIMVILAIIIYNNRVSKNYIKNLTQSERKINSFVRSMPFNSAILNADGICVESYFPYQSDKNGFRLEVGESISEFLSTDSRQNFGEVLSRCIGTGSYETLEFNQATDREIRYFELRLSPFFESGETLAIAIFIDITESQKTRQELLDAKQLAEKANQAKMQFLSNMSHEIRTPMNAIMGITDLVLEDKLDSGLRDNIEIIRKSADHLLVIINDILDLSKVEAGKIQIEQIPFSVISLVNQFADTLKIRAAQKGLLFKKEIQEGIPDQLIGDPVRLNQILVNLMGNAIKFTKEGEVKISLKIAELTDEKVWLIFKISDTGIGISKENQEKIFETFNQETLQISRQFGGTGLGLSISKQLTQLMGGNIELQSEKGYGSTFSLILPFSKSVPNETAVKVTKQPIEANLSGLNILIVEDNLMNQLVVSRLLAKWNCTYAIAENGQLALDKLKKSSFDLILMDLQMPVMDGIECAKLIRNELHLISIPIIALTADAFPEVRAEAIKAGMNDFVSKPFKQAELYAKIVNLVKPS